MYVCTRIGVNSDSNSNNIYLIKHGHTNQFYPENLNSLKQQRPHSAADPGPAEHTVRDRRVDRSNPSRRGGSALSRLLHFIMESNWLPVISFAFSRLVSNLTTWENSWITLDSSWITRDNPRQECESRALDLQKNNISFTTARERELIQEVHLTTLMTLISRCVCSVPLCRRAVTQERTPENPKATLETRDIRGLLGL